MLRQICVIKNYLALDSALYATPDSKILKISILVSFLATLDQK